MTDQQIEDAKKDIDSMSQYQMAFLRRNAKVGHPYFDRSNVGLPEYFEAKFKEKGGMTSEISKEIGWR